MQAALPADAPADASAPVRFTAPLMRGWLHLFCFFVAVPAGVYLILDAGSAHARVGAVVYAVGLAALFGVSGTYHRRRWTPAWRERLRRLDHSTIFVMIAGTYTPLCLVAFGGVLGTTLLVSVWAGAAVGVLLAVIGVSQRRYIGGACYLVLGWVAVMASPALIQNLTAAQLWLILAGGVLYSVGVIVLGTKRPDPFPKVFGYHEVWHAMVVAAAVCHFVAIQSLVVAA